MSAAVKRIRFFRVSMIAIDRLSVAFCKVGMFGLLLMLLLITFDVCARYFASKPTMFADEISGYLLALIVCMGLAETFKDGKHVSVTALVDKLPEHWRRPVAFVSLTLSLICIATLTWQSGRLALTNYSLQAKASTVLLTPIFIPQLPILLGTAVMCLQVVAKIGRVLSATREVAE